MTAAQPRPISPPESAQYTSDQLESLARIATGQGQDLLAHLLELARVEAKSLARANQDQQTRPPG
jgi:hypothetical protein